MNEYQNTPGIGGYVLAVTVSVVTIPLLLWVLSGSAGVFVVSLYYAAAAGIPIGTVGATVVHLCCRGIRAQVVHVLAAGLAGFLVLPGFAIADSIADSGPNSGAAWVPYGLVLAGVTATGRAAVIPIVHRRRRGTTRGCAPPRG